MYIATLIAPECLSPGDISAACDAVAGVAGSTIDGVACDIMFPGEGRGLGPDNATGRANAPWAVAGVTRLPPPFAGERQTLETALPHLDIIIQPAATRAKSLLIADMDSTMITVECIDELADYAGIKPQIAAITERAMRGELDFLAALTERVALLAGMKESVIAECLATHVHLTPGARTLVRTMTAHGARAVLVSGGFTRFAEPVAAMAGFDVAIANVLEIDGGVLTGRVLEPIVDSGTKRRTLDAECAALGIHPSAVLAVGDGANDIPMLEAAGLGVAYRGHPKAVAAADAAIRHGDLTALLNAQGYRRRDWVVD